MSCEHCGIKLRRKESIITHINIAQPLKEHHFCSELCKNKWCYRVQRKTHVYVVMWALGRFKDRYFFIKKKKKTNSPSLVGTDGSKSYFFSQLNQIEVLELKELNGRWVLAIIHEPK